MTSIYTEFVNALSLVDYAVMGAAATSIGIGTLVMLTAVFLLVAMGDIRAFLWTDKVKEETIEMPEADVFALLDQVLRGQVVAIDEVVCDVEQTFGMVVGDSYVFEGPTTYRARLQNDLYDMDGQGVASTMNWFNAILMAVPAPVADTVTYTYKAHLLMAVRAFGKAVEEVGLAIQAWADGTVEEVAAVTDRKYMAIPKAKGAKWSMDRKDEVRAHNQEVMDMLQGDWTTTEEFDGEYMFTMTQIDDIRVVEKFWI